MWVKGEIFRDLDAITSIEREGLGREAQPSLFDRIEWFRRTWTHRTPGDRPLIVRARTAGSDAWLFLTELGAGRAVGLASWYTLAFRPVLTGAREEETTVAMLTAIARRLKSRLATIALDHVPADAADQLVRGFSRAGWVVRTHEQTAHWTVDTREQDFATYWNERPGTLRSTAKRKAAKVAIECQVLDRFDEGAWADYEAVYAASWKPEEGSLDFLREMAIDESAAGALRLGLAHIDGTAVAAQLWTVDHGRAIIHKLAHREDATEHSPGTILSKAMFEHVIDRDRVDTIDFGTGDDRYKADWMTDRAMLMRVSMYNPRRIGGLLAMARARVAALVARHGDR